MTAIRTPVELTSELADLKRRLTDLETRPRMGNAALVNGAFVVLDDSSQEFVRLGELGGGLRGLRSVGGVIEGGTVRTQNLILLDSSGNEMPLSRLLQPAIDSDAANLQFGNTSAFSTGTVYAKNTWIYDSSISATIAATSFLVATITCRIEVSLAVGELYAGYRVTQGGTTIEAPALGRSMLVRFGNVGQVARLQASIQYPVPVPSPGTYTITPAYYLSSLGATDAAGIVNNRSIMVQGY